MLKRENIIFLLFSIVSISIGLLTTYLLSNYFSTEEFGQIQFLLTIFGMLTIFYLSGFDIIIIKQIYKKNDNIVKFVLKNIMPYSLLLLIITSVILYMFLDENRELVFYSLLIVSVGLFDKTSAILNAKLKFKQLRYLEVYTKISLLVLVLISINMNFDIKKYILYFVLLSLVIIVIRFLYSLSYLKLKNKKNVNYIEIKKEGIETSVSTAYNIFVSWFDKFIIGLIDLNMLAVFVIGQLFSRVIKDNIKIILIPTLNTWSSNGFEYYKSKIYEYKLYLYLTGLLVYILIYFLIDVIISNFFIKYKESILIAQLLAIPLFFKFTELVMMSSMALSKYTNIFNKINNISNTVKMLLVVILIPLYGIYGAIASILIVEVSRFFLVRKEFSKL